MTLWVKWPGHAATAVAVALGVWLLGMGVVDQMHRLSLDLHQGLGFIDPACTTGYCDYTMFWLAGILARHGEAALLYDHARYVAAAGQILPYKSGYWPFVYPPMVLPLSVVFSYLPLVAGYYAFSLAGLVVSVWLLRRAGIPGWWIAVGLLGPAAMWDLYLGQVGVLCGALLIAGLAAMNAKPYRAGGMLALLGMKPQYALLVPVVVLAARQWRALVAGGAGLALFVAVSWWHEAAAWAAYWGAGRVAMRGLLEQAFAPGYQSMGTSVFWMLRSLHLSVAQSYGGQGVVSAACAFATWRLWRAPMEPMRRIAVAVILAVLASPYGFTDDLAAASIMLPALAAWQTPWRNAVLAWVWVAPAFVPKFVALTGVLPTPLLLLAALVVSGFAEQKQPLLAE